MTVRELITRLQTFDEDAQVYIPESLDGKNDTVSFVCHMPHINIPIAGIHVQPDVCLMTGRMEAFVTDSEKIEDRMGDT